MEIDKKVAQILLDAKAVKINAEDPFTYASGIKSPIYCDNRFVLGEANGRSGIIDGFVAAIPKEVEVIVGVATAGIPWGAVIAHILGKPFAYVRSKPKDHGAGKQIEGADIEGKKLAVIEDLISTGGSSLEAVKTLLDNGAKTADVYAIFSYQFPNIMDKFKDAGSSLTTLSNFGVLINMLVSSEYLSKEQGESVLQWNKNPKEWYAKYF